MPKACLPSIEETLDVVNETLSRPLLFQCFPNFRAPWCGFGIRHVNRD